MNRDAKHSFHGKSEARFQLRRWKPKELVDSRKHIAREYSSKPWLLSFFKGVFEIQIKKPAHSILDVGCGTGFHTRFISSKVIKTKSNPIVIGCDLNRELLRVAKKQSSHLGFGLEYVQASAYNLPFRSDRFDLVTCRTVLMWLSSPLDAVKEMTRVASKAGHVACEEPDWGMQGYYDPSDPAFSRMDTIIGLAAIAGREIVYGHSPAMGIRLPALFHEAGLRKLVLEGTFHSIRVPSDFRTRDSDLRNDLRDSLEHHARKENYEEFKRAALAGGIQPSQFNRYIRVWKSRTERRIKMLEKDPKLKEDDTSFFAIPFFLAIGRKGFVNEKN